MSLLRNEKNRNVGVFTPASQFLANEITHYIGNHKGSMDILEIVPDTGIITTEILKKMNSEDSLTIYGKSPKLINSFKNSIFKLEDYKIHKDRINIIDSPIQNISMDRKYDFIILGIPINNLEPALVSEILNKLLVILKPEGILSYYESLKIPQIERKILIGEKRKKSLMMKIIIKNLLKKHEFKRERIYLNLPPMYVHYLKRRMF